jgi:hypothetical protein
MLVPIYQIARRHIPDDRIVRLHVCRSVGPRSITEVSRFVRLHDILRRIKAGWKLRGVT